jgi:hypothetical protein
MRLSPVTTVWLVRAMLAGCAVSIILLFARQYYTVSADLGWHYAYIEFILQHGSLPGADVMYLRRSIGYPPGAHLLTAAVASILGASTLQTIFLSSIASIFAIYFIILVLLGARDRTEYFVVASLLIFFLFLLRRTHMLLGNEVVGNFFYAHLVGGLGFFALLLISKLTSPILYFVFAVAAVHALAWIYTTSAVQLAVAAGLLQMMALARENTRAHGLTAIALMLVLPLTIVSHPTFLPMMRNAAVDAGISVRLPLVLYGSALLLVLATAVWSFNFQRRSPVPSEVLVAAGLSAGLLAWVQCGFWYFADLGSPYAVKKHGFMVGTLVAASLAAILAQMIVRSGLSRRLEALATCIPTYATRGIAACLALAMVLPWTGEPLAPVVEYESQVHALVASGHPADLLEHTISVNRHLAPIANIAVAMAILRLNGASPAAISDQFAVFGISDPWGPTTVRYAITVPPEASPPPTCVVEAHSQSSIQLIRRNCLVIPPIKKQVPCPICVTDQF